NTIRNAAQQSPMQTAASAGSHDNQVGLMVLDRTHNGGYGLVAGDVNLVTRRVRAFALQQTSHRPHGLSSPAFNVAGDRLKIPARVSDHPRMGGLASMH